MGSMKRADSGPMQIPEDIQAKRNAPNQFQNFDRLFRKVISKPPRRIDAKPSKKILDKNNR